MSMEGSTPQNLSADILSFAKAKGLYAGLSLEGAFLKVREDWNLAYYGKAVDPMDIIIKKSVSNPRSAPLQQRLEAIAGRLEDAPTYLKQARTRARAPQVRAIRDRDARRARGPVQPAGPRRIVRLHP